MSKRKALLVGSLPFENEQDAMNRALQSMKDDLFCLPDGEIGEKTEQYPLGSRSAWAMVAIDLCLADTEHWEIIKEGTYGDHGFPVDYDTLYKVRPKCSPEETPQHLNFHYHDYFQNSYPQFQQLRKEHEALHLKFQVGTPTGMAIALHMLEPDQIFRYYDAFNERLAFEINEILKQAHEDVVIQLELPAEIGLIYQMPEQMNHAIQSVIGLINRFEYPAIVGLHLCYGDLNNKALTHPDSLKLMADFTNELIQQWPQAHTLQYVHFPLAEGDLPPKAEKSYYEPLRNIQMPTHTRFVAGIVHEKSSLDELKAIRNNIESLRQHPIDVSCSCGLGRRSPEISEQLMQLTSELTED